MVDKHENPARDHLRLVHSASPEPSDWDAIMAAEVPKSEPIDAIYNSLRISFSMSEFSMDEKSIQANYGIKDNPFFCQTKVTWFNQDYQPPANQKVSLLEFVLRTENAYPSDKFILKKIRGDLYMGIPDLDNQGAIRIRQCTDEELQAVADLIDQTDLLNPEY